MQAIICSFSTGIDDLKRWEQGRPEIVLPILVRDGRFSAFEASANPTIARTMTRLYHKTLTYKGKNYGGPLLKHDVSMGYPWTKVVLTDAGRAFLADCAPTGQAQGGSK